MMVTYSAKNSLRTKLFAAALLFTLAGAQAQDDYVAPPKPSGFWASAYVANGGSNVGNREMVMADYRTLLEGSAFSQADLSTYRQSLYRGSVRQVTSCFVFGAGFHPFRGDAGKGPEMRVGFSYMSGGSSQLELKRSERYRLDTLSSSSSGVVYYLDSIYTSRYLLKHSSEHFGLDASPVATKRLGGRCSVEAAWVSEGASTPTQLRRSTRKAPRTDREM